MITAAGTHLVQHINWAGWACVMILVNGLAGAATVVVCSKHYSSPGIGPRLSLAMLTVLVVIYSGLVTAIFFTET